MNSDQLPASTELNASETSFLGHPRGLFVLFFVEMWERFSYYGMRSILVFYMIKGFLKYEDAQAYGVYGAYTALVYATPFLGGLLSDKILGPARAVIFGGMLMAAGHLLMTIESPLCFFTALALLICGNGFFKPNISTMVGSLYPAGSRQRDAGFTIFYMGINLGAAMSPLLCGYVGEKYGWHYGFGLATIGMLSGLATFVAPRTVARVLIFGTALVTVGALIWIGQSDRLMLMVNSPVAIALIVGAFVSIAALANGGLPDHVGAPAKPENLKYAKWVYAATAILVPGIALLVQYRTVAGVLLSVFGGGALLVLLLEALRSEKVERERLFVVLTLMFFSMLFWSFFEQAGSSLNNFADRNVQRVTNGQQLTAADVGKTLTDVPITSAFCGRKIENQVWSLTDVEAAQKEALDRAEKARNVDNTAKQNDVMATLSKLTVTESMVGMTVYGTEVKASIFQAVNPVGIVVFGMVLSWLWGALGRWEPSTSVKFALGLLQLGLGFGCFWWGAGHSDSYGLVSMNWLLLGYLAHTTGELCLSPVGLSMVTKLSPTRMISTVMGGWFLATAFSNFLAGMIAQLTGIPSEEGQKVTSIPLPLETVHLYGNVFGKIALTAAAAGVILWLLSPILNRWMHAEPTAGRTL